MGFVTAHAETQSFAHQAGWLHDKHDLTKSRTLALPSQSVPKQGQAPKVTENTESATNYNGPSPNHIANNLWGPVRPIKWFMGHIDVTGRSMFKSMDHQGQYFGSLTPGASLRFANGHTEHPSGASRCWKERFALMMCSREMSSERASNGPCAKEAYFFERCQTYKSDTDMHRNAKIIYADEYFGDLTNQYNSQAFENNFGWNKFGFSGQKGGIPHPDNLSFGHV